MSYSEEYPGQSDLIAAASLRLARVTAFVAVARRLSFTSAAEDLHVVQPWLSTQVLPSGLAAGAERKMPIAAQLTWWSRASVIAASVYVRNA